MLFDYTVKKPADTITVRLDFRDFVEAVAPEAVTYTGRGDIGPTYTEVSNAGGLITLQIAGGDLGRTYLYGYEARTASGESAVITQRLRVRDASPVSIIPTLPDLGSDIPVGGLLLDSDSILLGSDYVVLA